MNWKSAVQAQDFAWLLFVAALLGTAPEVNYDAFILVPLIGGFQIIEPRLQIFQPRQGQIISIVLKMMLGYLLIGFSHGADSYYSSIFLIPLVSAATTFDLLGVVIVTAISCGAYFSFLLPFFYPEHAPEDLVSTMAVRAAFYAIVAFLVYEQARAKRQEIARTREAADRLAESNKHLREAQASLRRSERLAALGQLTAGLAHELRNPLGTIKASAEMLTTQLARVRPELLEEMAGYVTSEVDRMNGLISSFLDFARPLRPHATISELRPLLDEVVKQQNELALSRGVALVLGSPEERVTFAFDPELMRVALSNLVQNAIQASESGQQVQIRADTEGDTARILVSDRGAGIPAENLENIFNPFFTTKPAGVGLGLAIVSKIVDEHQGRIRVFSEPEKGTTFELTFPKEQAS